jgi:methyl-accepting chemotaxis protein
MKLSTKILSIGIGPVLVASVAMLVVVQVQKNNLETKYGERIVKQAELASQQATEHTSTLVHEIHDLLMQKLHADLCLASTTCESEGGLRLDGSEPITWNAVNQFSKVTTSVTLPRMMVGDEWLGQHMQPSEHVHIVDKVKEQVGGVCTIFQKMNASGDMLRVATNVVKDGSRAIGTYIPAINPDGTPNPVIQTVMRGETYSGRAFVVDAWYMTAYKPIVVDNEVVGLISLGVPQEATSTIRQSLYDVQVGDTGYLFVIGGSGEQLGDYIVSNNGERDGENIWGAKAPDGTLIIQEMVKLAKDTPDGEIAMYRYPWKNAGDDRLRYKIAAVTYFKEWDWVIGAGCYEDDFEEERAFLTGVVGNLSWWSGIAAILVAVGSGIVSFLITRRIVGPLNAVSGTLDEISAQISGASTQLTSASQSLADATSDQAASLEETSASLEEVASMSESSAENARKADELSSQARAASTQGDQSVDQLSKAMSGIGDASHRISKIIKVIEEIAFQTNLLALYAAIEAEDAGAQGTRFGVVAEEVRKLAQRVDEAAKETSTLIEDAVNQAAQGANATQSVESALRSIGTDVGEVAELIASIARASEEQAKGVGQINQAVSQMDGVTQQNAANAEETASAATVLSEQAQSVREAVVNLSAVMSGKQVESTKRPSLVTRKFTKSKPAPVSTPTHG